MDLDLSHIALAVRLVKSDDAALLSVQKMRVSLPRLLIAETAQISVDIHEPDTIVILHAVSKVIETSLRLARSDGCALIKST